MKKQSKVEEALHKQLRWISDQIDERVLQQKSLDNQIDALRSTHNHICREINELRTARARASERNKTNLGE